MADRFSYDVFLSYCSQDRAIVAELAERLRADKVRVWIDVWEIKPGDMIGKRVDEGLDASRVLVLAMSRHSSGSSWATMESGTFRFRDPTNEERRFIPLRLDDAEVKDSLRQFAYVDWRTRDKGEYERLLTACRPDRAVELVAPAVSIGAAEDVRVLDDDNAIYDMVLTRDGATAIVGMHDGTLHWWDLAAGKRRRISKGHNGAAVSLAMTPDGTKVVSGGADDHAVKLWDVASGNCLRTMLGHNGAVNAVAVTPDGEHAISASDDETLAMWSLSSGERIQQAKLDGGVVNVAHIGISHDGTLVACGTMAPSYPILIFDLLTLTLVLRLEGHSFYVRGVAFTPDDRSLVSAGGDNVINIWNLESSRCTASLEGHAASVFCAHVTPDGAHLLTGSSDETIRLWSLETGACLATLWGHEGDVFTVLTTPDGKHIVSASNDRTIRIWPFPSVPTTSPAAARYTNAKVLLVGESGVGKTGLAYRLAENRFQDSISTGSAWATQLAVPGVTGGQGIEREIWLWDFAGQADYRLIQQLYMDETALAVLVFNPQNDDPFEGLGQWDRDLQRAARRPFRKLLVAGRVDRGGMVVARESLDAFMRERGFVDYIETSALLGTGCDALRDAIIARIPWDEIPWTASPLVFRRMKQAIVALKDEGHVLLRISELKQQLDFRIPEHGFTLEQLRAVVGLLTGPGVVWQLEFGDFVLLQPERINAYASAVIRSVRAHKEEIGCIAEEEVLAGKLDYQDVQRLPRGEEEIVLRAMHQTFVDHALCHREHTDRGTLLIFPSYFKRERPDLEGHPLVLVTYRFTGPLDEIYATLVVRLHHAPSFERDRLWRFAADFKTPGGKRLGLKMTRRREGTGELDVYFEPGIAVDVQVTFIRYVQEHLSLKAADVVRIRHYVCPHCGVPIENRPAIQARLERGLKDILCAACEERVTLWDLIEEKFASEEFRLRAREIADLAAAAISNESRELVLVGHAYAIAGESAQIYRRYATADHGIDGEIVFKDDAGRESVHRMQLLLESAGSFVRRHEEDGKTTFAIGSDRDADHWGAQAQPVMLVARMPNGAIQWMDVRPQLKRGDKRRKTILFEGKPFTALALLEWRARLAALPV